MNIMTTLLNKLKTLPESATVMEVSEEEYRLYVLQLTGATAPSRVANLKYRGLTLVVR